MSHNTLPAALLALPLVLVACTKDVQDTGETSAPQDSTPPVTLECDADAVDTPMTSGMWQVALDEALFNHCENTAGKGLHIHVGEPTMMEFDASALPNLTAVSDPGSPQAMTMTGSQEGAGFTLAGTVELEIGTCVVGINATMTGQMTGTESFCYQMDAEAFVARELSPDACSLIIGETENHTFPALPCDQAWVGTAAPAPGR